jgi:hypothetical protein
MTKIRTEEEIRRDLIEVAKTIGAPDPTQSPLKEFFRIDDVVREIHNIEHDVAVFSRLITIGPPEFVGEIPFRVKGSKT